LRYVADWKNTFLQFFNMDSQKQDANIIASVDVVENQTMRVVPNHYDTSLSTSFAGSLPLLQPL
jgi:hypothetical protein